VWLTFY
jgi:3-oxoacyl-[acyl-carrier-protein] synthase II